MNKERRHELKMLQYKRRVKRFAASIDTYIKRDGQHIQHPKTIDILKDNGQLHYKTSSTPCSCYLCSHSKYNRAKIKSDYRKHDKEFLS